MIGARRRLGAAVGAAFSLWLLTVSIAAQKPVPRTPDGRPDRRGFWDNSTLTPIERPAGLADQQIFSLEEAADFETQKRYLERTQARLGEKNVLTGEINGIWRAPRKLDSDRRTSLIVDPEDGRIPPLTPEARVRPDLAAKARKQRFPEGPEDLALNERCVLWGADPPLIPVSDNNILQIVQTRDSVTIVHEMMAMTTTTESFEL